VRPRVVQDPSDNGEPTEEQADGQPQEGGEQGDQPQDGSGGPQQGELQVGLSSQEQQQGQQQQLSECARLARSVRLHLVIRLHTRACMSHQGQAWCSCLCSSAGSRVMLRCMRPK
jgi:hypothetical protein